MSEVLLADRVLVKTLEPRVEISGPILSQCAARRNAARRIEWMSFVERLGLS